MITQYTQYSVINLIRIPLQLVWTLLHCFSYWDLSLLFFKYTLYSQNSANIVRFVTQCLFLFSVISLFPTLDFTFTDISQIPLFLWLLMVYMLTFWRGKKTKKKNTSVKSHPKITSLQWVVSWPDLFVGQKQILFEWKRFIFEGKGEILIMPMLTTLYKSSDFLRV